MTYLAQLKAKLSEEMPLHTPDKTAKSPSVSSVSGVRERFPEKTGSDLICEQFVEFAERAAILEFEAGLTRQQAERRALIELETIKKGN